MVLILKNNIIVLDNYNMNKGICPLCGNAGNKNGFPYHTVWKNIKYEFIKCAFCRTTYIWPIPSDSEFKSIYAFENYQEVFYKENNPGIHNKSICKLLEYCGNRRALLDFGCGNGDFLLAAKNFGFKCYGVEIEDKVVESAKIASKCPVLSVDAFKKSDVKFEIIHLGDVLEHLPNPYETMKELSGFLVPGGIFIIEGPLQNNASLVYYFSAFSKFIKRSFNFDNLDTNPPTHLILTNKDAQRKFFKNRLGFRELYMQIYETGWPYIAKGKVHFALGYFVRLMVGILAVALSFINIGKEGVIGNRFIGIYKI